MKLLIAISSCQRFEDNGWNDAIRNTWLKDAESLGVDYKFFIGSGGTYKPDIVIVPAGDDYFSLVYKTLEKYIWVLNNGYDQVFHCYHDTYACVERIKSVAEEEYDYYGDYFHVDSRQPWHHESYGSHCQSGAGAFLSRKALQYVVDGFPNIIRQHPQIWEEDLWTGRILREHEDIQIGSTKFMPCNLTEFDPGPKKNNKIISVHLSTIHPMQGSFDGMGRETEWKYRPEYMYKLHREWKDSCV